MHARWSGPRMTKDARTRNRFLYDWTDEATRECRVHPWADKPKLALLGKKGEKDALRGPKGPAGAHSRYSAARRSPHLPNGDIRQLGDQTWGLRTRATGRGQEGMVNK